MNLYHVHDDPDGVGLPEERWRRLIYADTSREAQVIAAALYTGDPEAWTRPWTETFVVAYILDMPGQLWPGPELDPEVQRWAGWGEQDEHDCEWCHRYANGLAQYTVCPECDLCPECGCAPDCPLREKQESTECQPA